MATATAARRVETDQSTAVSAFAALHVTFDATEQHMLRNITHESAEEDCIAAGATAIYMKHRYKGFLDTLVEERVAVFTNITVTVQDKVCHPACAFTHWSDGGLVRQTVFLLIPVTYYTDEMLPYHKEREAYWSTRDIVTNADALPVDLVTLINRSPGWNEYVEKQDASQNPRLELVHEPWTNFRSLETGERVYESGTEFDEAYVMYLLQDTGDVEPKKTLVNRTYVKIDGVWSRQEYNPFLSCR